MKQFSSLNENCTVLNAESKEKQATELTDIKWLMLPFQKPEIKQAVGTMFHNPAFKTIARATLQLSNKHEDPALVRFDSTTALTMTVFFHILSSLLFIKSFSHSSPSVLLEQSSNLVLVFASTVIRGFGPRHDP
jgi:hypothetical protein